jgi:hypothetical protein
MVATYATGMPALVRLRVVYVGKPPTQRLFTVIQCMYSIALGSGRRLG